jgi:prepilin-type N-terminal cleavage/methylation domain-containing protein
MKKLMGNAGRGQAGFTLVELIVVIAILGVLTALAVPALTIYLSNSKHRAYDGDRKQVQTAVKSYFSDMSNPSFLGIGQYPILGVDRSGDTLIRADHDHDTDDPDNHLHHDKDHGNPEEADHHTIITEDLKDLGNPLGGTQGGSPEWIDDGSGIRDALEEELLDDDAKSVNEPGWHVVIVNREGTDYIVDSRDYFIDFDKLVAGGYLEEVPKSASTDNMPSASISSYTGSYSWYVDANGRVESLLLFFPESDQTGFQDAYP